MRVDKMNKAHFHENWHLKPVGMNANGAKDNWLSDPSTYPIITVLSAAMALLGGMCVYSLTSYRDVRINPSTKHDELQVRDRMPYRSFTKSLASGNSTWAPMYKEGLGVDHSEWLKRKATDRK